jgi:hypothetical protein
VLADLQLAQQSCYVLCAVCCVLCAVCCVLCAVCCVLCAVCCVLCCVLLTYIVCLIGLCACCACVLIPHAGQELLLSQSYAKNMGLYGERVGALSVVCGW